jgi:hypothetical protein
LLERGNIKVYSAHQFASPDIQYTLSRLVT